MKLPYSTFRFTWPHLLAAATFMALAVFGFISMRGGKTDSFTAVNLTGLQHIGPDFNIPEFYVDGYYGSNVGRGGGGGSIVCCVSLPNKWRPGLAVDVRWAVVDWSKENLSETAAGNYQSLSAVGIYKALVPLEKYDVLGALYVHFFAQGRVRVVSSMYYPESANHPILENDPHAADSATTGTRVKEIFTKDELAAMRIENEEYRKKYGDWR